MPWFGQTWLDRIRGRGRAERAEPEAERAAARADAPETAEPVGPSDIEEGASAARDENVIRHEPFHPPGG